MVRNAGVVAMNCLMAMLSTLRVLRWTNSSRTIFRWLSIFGHRGVVRASFAPVFEDVAEERSGKMRFVKVNTEAERELSARFRIRSIPTIMIFKNGEVIDMLNGAVPKAPFDSWLNESL